MVTDAYLDIETTGLSQYTDEITVIGVGLSKGRTVEVAQVYDDGITADALRQFLQGVRRIFTYNGARFDLPFIHYRLGVDVEGLAAHHDLMLDCWQKGLYGGFKAVERTLGIPRELPGMDGFQAVLLWQQYKACNDQKALETLLAYNREDVSNLAVLQRSLARYSPPRGQAAKTTGR